MLTKEDLADSVLLIHKPTGMTSFDVVGKLRRILSQRKIGHCGTLDKAASGLLIICTGKGTRLSQYFLEKDKCYTGVIKLGIETDSCDSEGEVIRTAAAGHITLEMIEFAAERFRGSIVQKPPVYSALKIGGKRASDLARKGIDVEMKERPVEIRRLDIKDFSPDEGLVTIEVECSKGTYIRSLARDMGQVLGCGAYLHSLVRTSAGMFRLDDAVTPDELKAYLEGTDTGKTFSLSLYDAAAGMGQIVVDAAGAEKVSHGAPFTREQVISAESRKGERYAISSGAKNLIAIADVDIDNWRVEYRNVFI